MGKTTISGQCPRDGELFYVEYVGYVHYYFERRSNMSFSFDKPLTTTKKPSNSNQALSWTVGA